jgi:uncharacterized membrane protein
MVPLAIDLPLAAAALAVALVLRPWRAVAGGGPPWPWLACWAVMPLLWSVDRLAGVPAVQSLSGAALLVLLAGWPLASLAMAGVAAVAMALGGLDPAQALHRLVWLGLVPGTLAFAGGMALRRWLPHHLFVYILGRGFFVTLLATAGAGAIAVALFGAPPPADPADLLVARWLAASGEAFITGMFTAIFVAFRPQWLATWSDERYLRR